MLFASMKTRAKIEDNVSNLDLVVISAGGSATTALIEYLQEFVAVNSPDDADGMKHLPKPPPGDSKKIFIEANLLASVESLERRGISRYQLVKLSNFFPFVFLPKGLVRKLLIIFIKRQRTSFRRSKVNKETLIILSSDLHKSAPQISAFLGIPQEPFESNFPIWERP